MALGQIPIAYTYLQGGVAKKDWNDYTAQLDNALPTTSDGAEYIKFDINYSVVGDESTGTLYWDSDNKTYSGVLENGVVGQLFEEDFIAGQNDTGSTLTDGTVATYAGSIGNSGNIRIAHTVASASEVPIMTLGLVTSSILDGDRGKVTTRGKVRGIQTNGANYSETWADGEILYKSSTVAGGLTNAAPNSPIPAIPLAVVISAHASNGTLLVRPTFPQALTMLTDVNGTATTTSGQILVWDNVNGYFDFTENINDYQKRLRTVDRYTANQTLDADNDRVFCNGTFTITLPAGIEGTEYRIVNSGTGAITITPDGTENLIGANSSIDLDASEAIIITYNTTDGWY